jgi:predicted NAD/FAD-binding protein
MQRQILGAGDEVGGHATALIDLTARFALDRGFNVVLEGILNADWYTEVLLRLIETTEASRAATSMTSLSTRPSDGTAPSQ